VSVGVIGMRVSNVTDTSIAASGNFEGVYV
jgi:hypothetical protein